MFVFAIMVVAASRPILQTVKEMFRIISEVLPLKKSVAIYFLCLSVAPLLGSFITEPAAITLSAIVLHNVITRLTPIMRYT